MNSKIVLVLGVCGAMVLGACGKKDKDATADSAAPTTAATAPAPVASETPPAETATATAAPTTPPVVNNTPVVGANIDACCAGLVTEEHRAAPKNRAAARRAMEECPGIAKLVREGKTQRAAGLSMIRAAMSGAALPRACD
jgi:hypothetical protein